MVVTENKDDTNNHTTSDRNENHEEHRNHNINIPNSFSNDSHCDNDSNNSRDGSSDGKYEDCDVVNDMTKMKILIVKIVRIRLGMSIVVTATTVAI